ncbi:Hypothetical protein A7982_02411 [Minicystis rosea]|nr:Hypothetical protein A7982_02411 [Minicystis rosea]
MKHAIALCLFSSTLALFATSTAQAEPPKAKHGAHARRHKAPRLEQAKPIAPVLVAEPAKAEGSAGAPKGKTSFWMAAEPHVPLAMVDGKHIHGVGKRGKDCGAANRWAKPKSRWNAVDAWGHVTGSYEVKGAETFDLTGCREVSFKSVSGKPGAGLFVSEDSGYKPEASAAFTPSGEEKKRFEHFLGAIEGAFVDHKPLGKNVPWAKRTMFFEASMPKHASWEGRVDGAGKPISRPKRWAVSGGPTLTVAYLGQHGQWHAAMVKSPLGLADSYTPIAVFDMNGDGIPEIVYRQSDGPSYADAVLSLDSVSMKWDDAAESIGGAAL